MASWWHRDVIAPGKLPLMLCFLAFVTTFAVTRAITRKAHKSGSEARTSSSIPGSYSYLG